MLSLQNKMRLVKNAKKALQELYSSKINIFISLFIAVLVTSFNTLVSNYQILKTHFSFSLLFSMILEALEAMEPVPLTLLILTSLLAGVVFSMGIFLLRRQVKGSLTASSSGVLASVIAPSCPSCAIGLLSALGVGGFIGFLPFKGRELGLIGITILGVSFFYLSEKMNVRTCNVK